MGSYEGKPGSKVSLRAEKIWIKHEMNNLQKQHWEQKEKDSKQHSMSFVFLQRAAEQLS